MEEPYGEAVATRAGSELWLGVCKGARHGIRGHLPGSWIDRPGGIVGTAIQPAGADGSDAFRQVLRRAGEEAVFCGGSSSREEGMGRWLSARR